MLVAVSAGIDSTVLFHALHSLAGPLALDLCIGHVNHGLRAEASDGDETAVRELAEDSEFRSSIAGAGRTEVEEHYTWARTRREFRATMAAALGIPLSSD